MIRFQNAYELIEFKSPELKDSEDYKPNILWRRDYTGKLHSIKKAQEQFFTLEFANLTKSSQIQMVNFIKATGSAIFKYWDYSGIEHSVQFVEREISVGTENVGTTDEVSAVLSLKLRRIL